MTDSLIKADIFFVITTVAVIILASILCWALLHFIRILRNIENISEIVKRETKNIAGDIDAFREHKGAIGGIRTGLRLIKKFFSNPQYNKHKKGQ